LDCYPYHGRSRQAVAIAKGRLTTLRPTKLLLEASADRQVKIR
jgi:hypothetical protein